MIDEGRAASWLNLLLRMRLQHYIVHSVIFAIIYYVDASPIQQPPRSKSPWGIVDYGGDSTPLPIPVEDDDDNNEAIIGSNDKSGKIINSTKKFETYTSSQLVNSVSAGGGSPSDPGTTFVGAATGAATAMTSTAISKRPSSPPGINAAIKSPPLSLSVASNKRKGVENNIATASEEVLSIEEKDGQATTTIDNAQQQRPLRILFLSSDTGGGHRASAEALAAQFQRLFPGSTYDLLDVWTDIDSSWPYYTIKDTYKSFSATPWKWRALYHVSNNAVYAKITDLHSYYMNEDVITEKMEEYNPDVIGESEVLSALLYIY